MANVTMAGKTRPHPELWDKEWVESHIQSMTQSQIAEQLGCGRETVRAALRRFDIVQPRQIRFPILQDAEWLREQIQTRTTLDIADEVGCSICTVRVALKKHGIPIPTRGERRQQYLAVHVGERFGKMVVVEFVNNQMGHIVALMACDCGGSKTINFWKLRKHEYGWDHCGCLDQERQRDSQKTHGATAADAPIGVRRAYNSWSSMLLRCNRQEGRMAWYYTDDGIGVCERWLTFENFFEDMGERPEHTTLDRINPELGYSSENCQWGSQADQTQNKHRQIGLMESDWRFVLSLVEGTKTEQGGKIGQRIRSRMERWPPTADVGLVTD